VVELAPGDQRVRSMLVHVVQDLVVILDRVLAEPIHELLVFAFLLDAGRGSQIPQLHRQREDALVIEKPVIEDTRNDFLGMVAEMVIHGDGRIAGQFRAALGDRIIHPLVIRSHLVVRFRTVGAQDRAAVGVIGDRTVDVRMARHELDHRSNLRLGAGEIARAALLALGPPGAGEVAVKVEALEGRCDADQVAVIILDQAFGEDPVVGFAGFIGRTLDHQARVAVGNLPVACRIDDSHLQDAAVAVDVLRMQAVLLVLERIGPGAGADVFGRDGQRKLRAVRIEARNDIDHLLVEDARDPGVRPVAIDQPRDEMERGHGRGDLGRVNVGIDPERWLLHVRARFPVGQDDQRDIAAFMRLAQHREGHDVPVLRSERGQNTGQLCIIVISVEGRFHDVFTPEG